VFDIGCGNGAAANELHKKGFEVVGIDPSPEGIALAKRHYPDVEFSLDSTETELAGRYGRFPFVLSLEVIEHIFAPRVFARRAYDLLLPGGTAIISTPYNGYLKNLALALMGQMDRHFTALWDNGHIKFWSRQTLRALLEEAGFRELRFWRVGRIPPLAKSMIVAARKPES